MRHDPTSDPFNIQQVAQACATLLALGNTTASAALREQLDAVAAAIARGDKQVPAGWRATVQLTTMITHPSLGLPRVGDRVRVTFNDGREPITGTWQYNRDSSDGVVLPGMASVIDDETGHDVHDLDLIDASVGVLRLSNRLTGWEYQVEQAATILRSAWGAPDTVLDEYDPLNGCHGCARDSVGSLACAHTDDCTCRVCDAVALSAPSRCAVCAEPTQYRVSAWAPVPQYAAAVGLEGQAHTLTLAEPGESAAGHVCSTDCAREWIEIATVRLRESLGDVEAARQLFSVTRWTYKPSTFDLPAPLNRSRDAARHLAEYLDTLAEQWFRSGSWSTEHYALPHYRVEGLRSRVAEIVDHVAAMPNRSTGRLWPPSLLGLGEPIATAELPQALAHRVQVDPARYQVGAATVYDRVGQTYLCLVCPVETPVPLLSVDVVHGTLRDGLALRCVSCDAVLIHPANPKG